MDDSNGDSLRGPAEDPLVNELLEAFFPDLEAIRSGRQHLSTSGDEDTPVRNQHATASASPSRGHADRSLLAHTKLDEDLVKAIMSYQTTHNSHDEDEPTEGHEEQEGGSTKHNFEADADSDPLARAQNISKRQFDAVCDDFVGRFLEQGSSVTELHEELKSCNAHLMLMEDTLATYASRIGRVRHDISELKEKAAGVATQSSNLHAIQTVVAQVLEHLVVPPDAVQVILKSNDYNLGAQFIQSVKTLWRILRYRHGRWHNKRQAHDLQAAFRTKAERPTPEGSFAGVAPDDSLDMSMSSQATTQSAAFHRAVEVHLQECRAYHEIIQVIDDLTVFAALRIKVYMLQEINILAKPRTNLAIQQANVLLPHKTLMAFLRHAPSFLKHMHHSQHVNASHSDAAAGASGARQHLVHHRITQALYLSVRAHYVQILSRVYHDKMKRYLQSANELETPHKFSSDKAKVDADGTEQSTAPASSGWGFFGSTPATPNVDLPLLTHKSVNVTSADFALGPSRMSVFTKLMTHPLVPHVNRLAKRKHTYEETFRSFNLLLIDAVTSEFLFCFEFFAGDNTVYVDVFRRSIQLVIDYVSEVMLRNETTTAGGAHFAPGDGKHGGFQMRSCNKDINGILAMIRLTHLFKTQMHSVRKIFCLDGYFEALLQLLWPAFQSALSMQIVALRTLSVRDAAAFLTGFRSAEDAASVVHPITERYAELGASLMLLTCPIPVPPRLVTPDSHTSPLRTHTRRHSGDVSEISSAAASTSAIARGNSLNNLLVKDEDTEGENRMIAVRSTLSAFRIEFERLVEETAKHLTGGGPGNQQPPQQQRQGLPTLAAFRVNNFHHVIRKWREYTIEKDPHFAFPESCASSAAGPAANGLQAGTPTSPETPMRRFDSLTSSHCSPEGIGSAANPVRGALSPLGDSDDAVALERSYQRAKLEFVQETLRLVYPKFVALVGSSATATATNDRNAQLPADIAAVVEPTSLEFVQNWKTGLDTARQLVRRVIADAECGTELLKQICTQTLLYNTRMHALIGKLQSPSKPVRQLVVTNQQLMTHIRTMAAVEGHDDVDDDL